MRLSKYVMIVFAVTICGLIYTHQQFILIRANYNIIDIETRLSHLLDHNKKMMYNVTTLESPAYLESKLNATGVDYNVPVRWEMVKRSKTESSYEFAKVPEKRNVVLEGIVDFLTAKAEARALDY